MESNCRKLVSACVQLGKRNHLPPGGSHSGPAAVRCAGAEPGGAAPGKQRRRIRGRGCAAAGADRLSPVLCVSPPSVSPSPGVQPAAVECLFSKEADIKKGELGEAPGGRKEPAGTKLFGRPPPSANGKRQPLRAPPRRAARPGQRAGGSSAPGPPARRQGAPCCPPAARLRGRAPLAPGDARPRGKGERGHIHIPPPPPPAAGALTPAASASPPKKSIAVSASFGHPQRHARIYFYFLFFDAHTPPPPAPVNKPPALSCPQRQAPPRRPVCRQSELLPFLPLPVSGGLVGEPEGW